MILFFIILVVLATFFISLGDRPGITNVVFSVLISAICSVFITGIISSFFEESEVVVENVDKEILSLKYDKESQLRGSFLLGTGSISGGINSYYVFYEKDLDGGIKLKKLPVDEVTIYMNGGKVLRHVNKVKIYKPGESNFFFNYIYSREIIDTKYELHLPEGSIIEEINLNL